MQKKVFVTLGLAVLMTFGALRASAATTTVTIRIEGMHCENCAASVQKKLKATKGVEDVQVSFERKEALIKYEDQQITVAQLRAVINSTGYKAVEEKAATTDH